MDKAIEEEADTDDQEAPAASSELQLDYDPEREKNGPSPGKDFAKAAADVGQPVITTLAVGIVPAVLLGLAFPPAFALAFFLSMSYGILGVFFCGIVTSGRTGSGAGKCMRDVIGWPFTAMKFLAKGTWRLVKGLGRLGYKGVKLWMGLQWKMTKYLLDIDPDKWKVEKSPQKEEPEWYRKLTNGDPNGS